MGTRANEPSRNAIIHDRCSDCNSRRLQIRIPRFQPRANRCAHRMPRGEITRSRDTPKDTPPHTSCIPHRRTERRSCLQDPSDSTVMVGRVHLSVESATLANLEQQFWGRVLSIADLNGDGQLSCDEFSMLMQVCPRPPGV